MTDETPHPPQWADVVILLQRTRRYLALVAVGAIVVSLLAAGYFRSALHPRYTSEAIALVRAPVSFTLVPPQITTLPNPADDTRRGQPPFLPQPLDAYDYRVLLESDAVFARAAALYNERFEPHTALGAADFRGACVAMERLAVRTPYAAVYHPALSLRATAGDPELAHRLAQCWSEAAEDWARSYEQSVRGGQLAALEQVRVELLAQGARDGAEPSAPLALLEQAALEARVAAARGVYEFAIVAEPILPAPQGAPSVAVPSLVTGLVAFVGLYALVLCGALFAQAARSVRVG